MCRLHVVENRNQLSDEGLVPQVECYGVCRVAWGEYIEGSLKELIVSRTGRPDSYGAEKHEEAKARAAQLSA